MWRQCMFLAWITALVLLTADSVDGDNVKQNITEAPADGQRAPNESYEKWRRDALTTLWKERFKMKRTPLYRVRVPGHPLLELYFKDETDTTTTSLKHRFAWGLFHWAIIEGHIGPNTTVYESSSGKTAASEAYFAQMLNVPFVAVIPQWTEDEKRQRIKDYGGKTCEITRPYDYFFGNGTKDLAEKEGGFYMNQFANAEKAEEFHESHVKGLGPEAKRRMGVLDGKVSYESTNVFHEVIAQLKEQSGSIHYVYPEFFVHSVGTGGTISSVGRYAKKYNIPTEIVLADSEFSVFYDYVVHGDFTDRHNKDLALMPGVEGTTGFQQAVFGETTSLQRNVVDRAIKVPDLATTAAMWVMQEHDNDKKELNGGATTGLAFLATLSLSAKEQ